MGASTAQYGLKDRWVRSRLITFGAAAGAQAAIDVPAGTFIPAFGVHIYIKSAWGGCTAVSVGDSDVDGWVGAGDVTLGTVGMYCGTAANATLNDQGKIYTSADTIDVYNTSAATAGTAYVYARMIDVSDVYDD